MAIVIDQKHITDDERLDIAKSVKEELVDHLYAGCLQGTLAGVVISGVLFLLYYGYAPTKLLIAWLGFFNFMMLALTSLYILYIKFKSSMSPDSWELAYTLMMTGCAIAWVPGIFLMPADFTRQYLVLTTFFLATTGYATGSIGHFRLCVITLLIMLVPLMVWCFLKGGLLFNVIGVYAIIYMGFMFGINHRSTRWFIDSLKLKLENTLVSYQANHDLLTDLPNQRMLPQYIESAIASIENTKETFVLACFSLNRMEVIVDSLGDKAGNTIIQSVAARLNLLSQQFARTKGPNMIVTISRKETFNIILAPLEPEEIENKVRQLFSVLYDPFYVEQKSIRMTASIGVSIYNKDGSNVHTLLINADAAMLAAKQFGGNRLQFYRAEINSQLPKQLELETDLHSALEQKSFLLHYQPLVNIRTNKIEGMEALIRWPHPQHGFISPMHFIPIAEQTGMIIPLGEWVLKEACRQTVHWHKMGFTWLKVAVNVAEKQLRQEGIIDTVTNILRETGLPPQYLDLELTETAILDESTIPVIKKLKEIGVSLAVDDFGTGYSGLSYLKRFSIDKLKIDQSFIRDIPENNDSITIVSAIIAMGKELHVCTLAEGVETQAQLDFLKSKGCDFAQGYFFSKPLEASAFTQLLMNQQRIMAIPEISE